MKNSIRLIALFLLIGILQSAQAQICTECPPGLVPGRNLFNNGDFSQGDVNVGSGLPAVQACSAQSYWIGATPNSKCAGWSSTMFDHTVGDATGSYMIIDGFNSAGTNILWSQAASVTGGTQYDFEFHWRPDLATPPNPNASVQVFAGNTAISPVFGPGPGNNWIQECFPYIAPNDISVIFSIRQMGVFTGSGRDFAIDDISLICCALPPPPQPSCVCLPGTLIQNLVVNGNFNFGNTGFSSDLAVNPTCANNSYVIGNTPSDKCAGWSQTLFDHTYGIAEGQYMIVDGFTSGTGNTRVWHQNVNVMAGETYQFEFHWRPGLDGTTANTSLSVFVDNLNISGIIAPVVTSNWQNYCFIYTAEENVTVELSIQQMTNFGGGGHDFGIDDISFVTCDPPIPPCEVGAKWGVKQSTDCEFLFTNYSEAGVGSTIVGYLWDFGDGTTSTEANPTHVYAEPGSYVVCLTVYAVDQNGECCTDTYCDKVINGCEQEECRIDITNIFYSALQTPCNYQFGAAFTANRPIIGYLWTFGDGSTGTGANPIHNYDETGTYEVCVTIVLQDDKNCCIDTYCTRLPITCGHKPEDGKPGSADDQENQDYFKTANLAQAHALKIAPNPASTEVNLTFESTTNSAYELDVINLQGQTVLAQKGESNTGTSNIRLNTSQLVPGTYFIRLLVNGQMLTEKVILQ